MIADRWEETEASRLVAEAGSDPDAGSLALRVYSSRLVGSDPDLVMHGGGNTSIKLWATDVHGDRVRVLHVKGSGADLDTITAAGLPAVRLDPLLRLRALDRLSDEDMVSVQRANLLDSAAPNPSVETLLHAWLPDAVVDHTHATAVLALAALPDAAGAVREIFGDRVVLVPYIMPGFALAKAAAEARERHPQAEGLLLLKHGHFTWGATPRESYARVIAQTNAIEAWLAERRPRFRAAPPAPPADPVALLPRLRGALAAAMAEEAPMPILDLRGGSEARAFVERPDAAALSRRGVATPDHVIRTKAFPVHLPGGAQTPEAMRQAVTAWAAEQAAAFDRQTARVGARTRLPPRPGVAWVEGLGVVGAGMSVGAARINGDLAEQTIRVIADAEGSGGFAPIGEADTFDMEYWSLEQAKLGKAAPPPLHGRIVLLTGGAGAIGLATARAFAAQGAAVMLADRDVEALAAAARDWAALGRDHATVVADITAPGGAEAAVAACVTRFGGLDILVSNAGAAWTGEMASLSDADLRASFELNFFAHQAMAQAAVGVMRVQAEARGARSAGAGGGCLLFNVSKQAVNPGRGFGAYGTAKAATFFLLRQLALELGAEGLRVNGVNADRIRSGIVTDAFVAERSKARGLTPEAYMAGNLLGREVEARHVADAFVALARAERTTGHVLTVDGGNVEAQLR